MNEVASDVTEQVIACPCPPLTLVESQNTVMTNLYKALKTYCQAEAGVNMCTMSTVPSFKMLVK